MALEYKRELRYKNSNLIEKKLIELPDFVTEFIKDNETTKSSNTLLSYLRDISSFFTYLKNISENPSDFLVENISLDFLAQLSTSDLKAYERFLFNDKDLSNASIKRQLSSIASLYKYLTTYQLVKTNPLLNYNYPKAEHNGITYLTSSQTKTLLDGILSNSKKLALKNTNKFDREGNQIKELQPEDLTPKEALLKEKNVLRDFAVVILFLGTGLRISELVGIDLSDIDFNSNSVSVSRKGKGLSLEKVYFGEEVASALKKYIYGLELPQDIILKYPENFLSFCIQNAYNVEITKLVKTTFVDADEVLLNDIKTVCSSIRNFGRSNYNPKRGEDALFLSSKGKRLSVRMIQLIIKEKVLTYLPDMKDKDKISPHKLRSTAATRLLSQTDDILLVSKQLGHSSPTVTAKHYAQIQEEKEKTRLASLSISDW